MEKNRFFRLMLGLLLTVAFVSMIFVPTNTLEPVAQQPPDVGLAELAAPFDLLMGAAVRDRLLLEDETYRNLVIDNFNLIIPEHDFKMVVTQPERGVYDFERTDRLVAFAEEHNMAMRGHALVWHNALPDWINNGEFTRDELLAIMEDHIKTVMSRYEGQIKYWDVVNEAVEQLELRETVWLEVIGPEYIDLAYQWAHEADPDAHLMYNDYDIRELMDNKSDTTFNLLKGMVERGVPIHGVGFQMHMTTIKGLDPRQLEANFARYAEIGLDVHITEIDIQIRMQPGTQDERLASQAAMYEAALDVCLRAENCATFSTWGVSDTYTWITDRWEEDDPLLFDMEQRPKPAYFALANLLTEWSEK